MRQSYYMAESFERCKRLPVASKGNFKDVNWKAVCVMSLYCCVNTSEASDATLMAFIAADEPDISVSALVRYVS